MAQWLGFGTGDTHEKQAKDAAEALRHAVGVFREAIPEDQRRKKAKVVRRLAARVMWARAGLLKARIAVAREAQLGGASAGRSEEMTAWQRQIEMVRGGGIPAILAEFGAQDASVPGEGEP